MPTGDAASQDYRSPAGRPAPLTSDVDDLSVAARCAPQPPRAAQACEVGTGASDAPVPFGDAAPSADGASVLGDPPDLPPPAA